MGFSQSTFSLQCSLWAAIPEWLQCSVSVALLCSLALVSVDLIVWPTYFAFSEHVHWNWYTPGFFDCSCCVLLQLHKMSLSLVPDLGTKLTPALWQARLSWW